MLTSFGYLFLNLETSDKIAFATESILEIMAYPGLVILLFWGFVLIKANFKRKNTKDTDTEEKNTENKNNEKP